MDTDECLAEGHCGAGAHARIGHAWNFRAATRTFTFTGRDANGFADIQRFYFLVKGYASIPAGSCHGFYDRPSNAIFRY